MSWWFYSKFAFMLSVIYLLIFFLVYVAIKLVSGSCIIYPWMKGEEVELVLSGLCLLVVIMTIVLNWTKSNIVMSCCVLLLPVIMFFMSDHMLVFYVMFEVSLIPTFYMILMSGAQPERISATFYLIFYTIFASLPLLLLICSLNWTYCCWNINFLINMSFLNTNMTFFCFIFAFLVKVPLWCCHLWLPKAHVEAPVGGSMVLAGVLLKLGGYGVILSMLASYGQNLIGESLLIGMSLWGSVVVSVLVIGISDMKMIVAYSSVIHTNMIVLGLMSYNPFCFFGALAMTVGHGFTSPGMFGLVNKNYNMTGSRNLSLMKGFSNITSLWMLLWYPFIASNMAAPPFLNFIGEVTLLLGLWAENFIFCILLGLSMLLATVYNIYLYSAQASNSSIFMLPSKFEYTNEFLMLGMLGLLMLLSCSLMMFF